jgi:alpha-mannosidase II
MTDEANAHYYNMIDQMFEGHQWLLKELGAAAIASYRVYLYSDYRPRSHWSIDPFGLSSTMAWLVRAANISEAVIQRVHYSVKKHLAQTKQLEFRWRQLWGEHNTYVRVCTVQHLNRISACRVWH